MDKIPLFAFVRRYWILLVVLAVMIWAYSSGVLAVTMRGALLIPIFTLMAGVSGLLLRHTFNRRTTDRYVADRDGLAADWGSMAPWMRVVITKVEYLGYFLGGCLIAAGLVIIINV